MDKAFENQSLLKDIQDIDDMLNQYRRSGLINREKVISKIRELRVTNKDIGKVTMATLPFNFVPFSAASNDQLAGELNAYKLFCKRIICVISRRIPIPTLKWIGKSKVINHHQELPFLVFENDENLLPGAVSMSQFIDTIKEL